MSERLERLEQLFEELAAAVLDEKDDEDLLDICQSFRVGSEQGEFLVQMTQYTHDRLARADEEDVEELREGIVDHLIDQGMDEELAELLAQTSLTVWGDRKGD